jgi:hypothetical protein
MQECISSKVVYYFLTIVNIILFLIVQAIIFAFILLYVHSNISSIRQFSVYIFMRLNVLPLSLPLFIF